LVRQIKYTDRYSFIILKCSDPYNPDLAEQQELIAKDHNIAVHVDALLLNPQGQHLTAEEIPYLTWYLVLLFCYAVTTIVFVLMIAIQRFVVSCSVVSLVILMMLC